MSKNKTVNIESLSDLPGIGPVSLKKLNDEGYETMLQVVAELSITDLVAITGMDRTKAGKAFSFMKNHLRDKGLIPNMEYTADKLLEERAKYPRLLIGCKAFDQLLASEQAPDGGIEFGSITELYGENGSGKTQTSHTLTLNFLSNNPEQLVAYIDTEGTFRPERINEMAVARGCNDDFRKNILERIIVIKVHEADAQLIAIQNINSMLAGKTPVGMIVVDSGTALFRGQFLGRGNTKSKFDLMNSMLHKLKGIAEFWKIPVIFVNQIYHKPDEMFGKDTDIPYGGNIVGHLIPYRIKLQVVGSGKRHRATLKKSPYHANNEALYKITEKGIEDVD